MPDRGSSANADLLAKSLFDEMSKLVRERRFEDFAAKFHPLDLAKFKNVILAIVDLAHDISDAEQFCSQFDRYIQRKEIVEIPPDQVFATYCQAVLFPDVESQADIAATDDAWQYCGVVVEDDETLHVLYRVLLWPTVATYRQFKGRWLLTARTELAKLSAFLRNIELPNSPDAQIKKIQDLVDTQLDEIRVIGRVDEGRWSHLVCFLQTSCGGLISESYEAWTISDDEPAYAFPGDPAALEKALRERHHEQKSKMVELMRLMSEIVKRFDEGPA